MRATSADAARGLSSNLRALRPGIQHTQVSNLYIRDYHPAQLLAVRRPEGLRGLVLVTPRCLPEISVIVGSLRGQAPQAKPAWSTETMLADIRTEVARINAPTIVLSGERDQVETTERLRQELLPHIAGARSQDLSGGCQSMLEAPQALAQAIEPFVGRLSTFTSHRRRAYPAGNCEHVLEAEGYKPRSEGYNPLCRDSAPHRAATERESCRRDTIATTSSTACRRR
jgi:hypothetical protein